MARVPIVDHHYGEIKDVIALSWVPQIESGTRITKGALHVHSGKMYFM